MDKLILLNEFDFKIQEETGLCQIVLTPKNPDIKKILFYSPLCIHCQEYIKKMTEKEYAVNTNESYLLATHFNITSVPFVMNFG